MKNIGVMSMGIKLPVLKEGDDLVESIVSNVLEAKDEIGLNIEDKDIIAVTESIVARTQGNYATVDEIASAVKHMFGCPDNERLEEVILYQPVLSRNRFAVLLRGIARASEKVWIQFTAPTDEVGNEIVDKDWYLTQSYETQVDIVALEQAAKHYKHKYTGINYIDYYKSIVESEDSYCIPMISNNKQLMKDHNNLIICNVHEREIIRTYFSTLFDKVLTLQDILSDKSEYGLLGSNKVDEETVKLFPRNSFTFVESLQKKFKETTGKTVEVLVYGDGGFKCPVCGVWEELDPVISPGYTKGLDGTPNELKLKYFADNDFKDETGTTLEEKIKHKISVKRKNLVGNMSSQGTTPRRYTDLLGSLADLTTGSGDKGTPVVWIKNYFKNYSDD